MHLVIPSRFSQGLVAAIRGGYVDFSSPYPTILMIEAVSAKDFPLTTCSFVEIPIHINRIILYLLYWLLIETQW